MKIFEKALIGNFMLWAVTMYSSSVAEAFSYTCLIVISSIIIAWALGSFKEYRRKDFYSQGYAERDQDSC